jgi:hypothetical protein
VIATLLHAWFTALLLLKLVVGFGVVDGGAGVDKAVN